MATIREYFDTDFKCGSIFNTWEGRDAENILKFSLIAKVYQDLESNAKFWSFFLPDEAPIQICVNSILARPITSQCILSENGDSTIISQGLSGYTDLSSSNTLVFTKRIYLYIDADLTGAERLQLAEQGTQHGYSIIVRDREYAKIRSDLVKPLAFISHDSRDKEDIVRDLAFELTKLSCPVWYDEYSLKVGDRLRESIEEGLRNTSKCIVILSPHFLSNNGWGKTEFDSVFSREILEKKDVILPVWHNVDIHDVYQYSPTLANRVGLKSSLGIEKLAKQLSHVIKP